MFLIKKGYSYYSNKIYKQLKISFMKTPKLMMAIIAVLLFSNFLFAGNPSEKII